jgi:hypothetical protein
MKRMMRGVALLALAAVAFGSPFAAEAQAQKYQVTAISKIAPNALKYLLSHYTGAGALESKIATLEADISHGAITIEGPEGKQGAACEASNPACRGERGPQGIAGESIEGPEGRASTIPGPAGAPCEPTVDPSCIGPEGPEGRASEVPGPQGERGEKGAPCEVKVEPACASTVPGPRGEKGESIVGPEGKEGKASTVPGPKGEKGESIVGPKGERGEKGESIVGPAGPQGEKGEPGSGSLPSDYINPGNEDLWTGSFVQGATHEMLRKKVPAGQYQILAQLSFRNNVEGQEPEEMVCSAELGGVVFDETIAISPRVARPGVPSSMTMIFGLPETKTESEVKIFCKDIATVGNEKTFETGGGEIAAMPVSFK